MCKNLLKAICCSLPQFSVKAYLDDDVSLFIVKKRYPAWKTTKQLSLMDFPQRPSNVVDMYWPFCCKMQGARAGHCLELELRLKIRSQSRSSV